MRAAVLHGRGDLRVEELPEPVIQADELLIEPHAVGVCGTDAHEFADGPRMFPIDQRHPVTGHVGPFVPGHEISGVVRQVGANVVGFAEGELVVSGAGVSCGRCPLCAQGRTNLCERYWTVGLQRNGALAEYVAVPAATCVRTEPYGLTADAAALAQPMAIAVHALRRGRLARDEEAVVVGAGGIGAFLTFAARSWCESVAVLDVDSERLSVAAGLGADHVVDPRDDVRMASVVKGAGRGKRVVFEVSGTSQGMATALSLLGPGGRLVLVGLHGPPSALDLRMLSLAEHTVVGTLAHVVGDDLPVALELIAGRTQPWSDIAPVAVSLDRVMDEAIVPMAEKRATRIKTLVDPWATATRATVMIGRGR